MNQATLLLGSNQGDRLDYLQRAIQALAERGVNSTRESSIHQSEPFGFDSPHPFVNQVLVVNTSASAFELLEITQGVELALGRAAHDVEYDAEGNRVYHDRTIDIDILYYNDEVINTPRLTVPHPEIMNREFVMVPLRELGLL